MKKGYRFRIYPDANQRVLLARTFGCTRFVWNTLLDESIKTYEAHKENPQLPRYGVSGYDFTKRTTVMKANYEFLLEPSIAALQQKALDLGKAYSGFFKKQSRFPKFKSKRDKQTFRLVGAAFSTRGNQFYIAKCKTPIKIKWSRQLPSEPSSVTISQEPNGHYYASFVCEFTPEPTNGEEVVGIDVGLSAFYTDSNGQAIEAPKYYRKTERRLAKAQRRLSKKQKGSKNREKARLRVAKLHAKTKHQRNDFLHKLSRDLVNRCRYLCVEDITTAGLMKNRHLAKSIADVGWGKFFEYLVYKTVESQWCSLIIISKWYPSTQTCNACGHRMKGENKLKLSQRRWQCPSCNTLHSRDENAAMNIMNEGLRIAEVLNSVETQGKLIRHAV